MTAIDQWILELQQSELSKRPMPLASTVDTAVAALQYIESGLGPITGPENANTVLAGPANGAPADPTFRALVPKDIPIATDAALGGVIPDGTIITVAVNGDITVAKASAANFGVVEVDGTTITEVGGVISAAAGAGPFLPLAGGTVTGTINALTNLYVKNQLLVATSSTSAYGLDIQMNLVAYGASVVGASFEDSSNTSGSNYIIFGNDSSILGSITNAANTGVAYNNTSDETLKNNWRVLGHDEVRARIDGLFVGGHKWIANQDAGEFINFKAQQGHTIHPQAFQPGKNKTPWMRSVGEMEPLLTLGLQHAFAYIDSHEARLSKLEGKAA